MHADDLAAREARLSAWLDGALDRAEADAFAMEMAADPALARMAEDWRNNDRRIATALTDSGKRPLSRAVRALFEPSAANDNPPFWRSRPARLWSGLALGAVAAAAIAVMVSPRPTPLDPLSRALDRTPSLASATLPDGRRIVPALTVQAKDGRWCREYRDGSAVALACRDTAGRWHDEGRGAGEAPGAASNEIAVASGADDAVLDSTFQRLGTGDALDAKAEAKLISARWGR
jgi:anti-sigma factor RsiW